LKTLLRHPILPTELDRKAIRTNGGGHLEAPSEAPLDNARTLDAVTTWIATKEDSLALLWGLWGPRSRILMRDPLEPCENRWFDAKRCDVCGRIFVDQVLAWIECLAADLAESGAVGCNGRAETLKNVARRNCKRPCASVNEEDRTVVENWATMTSREAKPVDGGGALEGHIKEDSTEASPDYANPFLLRYRLDHKSVGNITRLGDR